MDYDKLIHCLKCCARVDAQNVGCDDCGLEYCGEECQQLCGTAATALSTLQAENEKLRSDLALVTAERDAAQEAVKNMAEYIVCAGRVDYFLCDEISQEHHLKYQSKNDGNYDNEPCYKCVADWFLKGHKWQGSNW